MIPPEVRTHGTVHNEPFRKLVHLLTEREPEKLTGTLNDKIRDEISFSFFQQVQDSLLHHLHPFPLGSYPLENLRMHSLGDAIVKIPVELLHDRIIMRMKEKKMKIKVKK